MRSVSANDFARTILCDWTGCPLDAEPGTTRCREHPSKALHPPAEPTLPRHDVYTRNQILGAIDRWVTEHGEPPKATDWARRGDYWPNMTTVVRAFGKWSAAIAAAGFDPKHHKTRAAVSEREPNAEASAGEADRSPAYATPASAAVPEHEPLSRSETAARIKTHFNDIRADIDQFERALLDGLLNEAA